MLNDIIILVIAKVTEELFSIQNKLEYSPLVA